jgi:hypothetical protein
MRMLTIGIAVLGGALDKKQRKNYHRCFRGFCGFINYLKVSKLRQLILHDPHRERQIRLAAGLV